MLSAFDWAGKDKESQVKFKPGQTLFGQDLNPRLSEYEVGDATFGLI
jgi:hypothetical protein